MNDIEFDLSVVVRERVPMAVRGQTRVEAVRALAAKGVGAHEIARLTCSTRWMVLQVARDARISIPRIYKHTISPAEAQRICAHAGHRGESYDPMRRGRC